MTNRFAHKIQGVQPVGYPDGKWPPQSRRWQLFGGSGLFTGFQSWKRCSVTSNCQASIYSGDGFHKPTGGNKSTLKVANDCPGGDLARGDEHINLTWVVMVYGTMDPADVTGTTTSGRLKEWDYF